MYKRQQNGGADSFISGIADRIKERLAETGMDTVSYTHLVDGIESVNAGFINLARVQLSKAETLKIQLSEGLVNVDDVQEEMCIRDRGGTGADSCEQESLF